MTPMTSLCPAPVSSSRRGRTLEHSQARTLKGTDNLNGLGLTAPPLRVLVVDDDPDTLESAALLVQLFGHETLMASNGPGALALAQVHRFDVALLDIALGGPVDGLEVARRLRCQEGLEKVVLVAVTGYAHESYRRRCRDAGFDHYLVKPVDPDELARLLTLWARSACSGS